MRLSDIAITIVRAAEEASSLRLVAGRATGSDFYEIGASATIWIQLGRCAAMACPMHYRIWLACLGSSKANMGGACLAQTALSEFS